MLRALLLVLLFPLLVGFGREVEVEEPWESCHARVYSADEDAQMIADWEASRTTNNWGPNWSGATPLPGRTEQTVFTTSSVTPTHPGEPKYALSNSRAIYLFDQYGRLRGGVDRARGVEIVRRDGSSTASPWAFSDTTWNVKFGCANTQCDGTPPCPASGDGAAPTGWGISTFPVPTVSEITAPDGSGAGMRVVHVRDGLTLTKELWLDGEALRIVPKSITGEISVGTTACGGDKLGLHNVSMFLPGLTYDSGIQDVYYPGNNDGIETLNFTDGGTDDGVFDAEVNGNGAASSWTGNYLGFMIDRRFGVYLAVEDPNGYPVRSFTFRTRDQSNGFNVAFNYLTEEWGEAGAPWYNSAPITIRPFCSELGYAAIAKHYRRFAIKHNWSHPPLKVAERTDALVASDAWGAINSGSNADAAYVRDEGCTGATCDDKQFSPDHYLDEFGNQRFAFWYVMWASEVNDLGSFNHPVAIPKLNADSVLADMKVDFPTYQACRYFNAHTMDLGELYKTGGRCGQEGDAGDGSNVTLTVSSHDQDSYASIVMQAAGKWPHHEAAGVCNRATPENCHHQGYFVTTGTRCVVEGNAAYDPFREFMVGQVRDAVMSGTPPCIYLDTAPQGSPARFDSSDTDRGYKRATWEAVRRYYAEIANQHPDGVYALTREHAPDYVNAQIPSVQTWSSVPYSTTKGNIRRVPLWSLVWHDWLVGGGGYLIHSDDDASATYLKLARNLVFGSMAMISWDAIDAYDNRVNGPADGTTETVIKGSMAARRNLEEYLVEGELLGAVEYAASPASDTESFLTWCNSGAGSPCGTSVAGSAQSIQAGWWRGSDGTYALVYANADPSNASTAYVVPPPRFRQATKTDCLHSESKGSCAASPGFVVEEDGRWKLVANAGQVRVLYLDGVP